MPDSAPTLSSSPQDVIERFDATLRSFYSSGVLMGVVELPIGASGSVHVYGNPATERFFSVSGARKGARLSNDFGVPDDVIAAWTERYRESERLGLPVEFEYCHQVALRKRWLKVSIAKIEGAPSEPQRFSYLAQDITDSKKAAEELAESVAMYRSIFKFSTQPMWFVDNESLRIVSVNGAAIEHYGYTAEEFLRMNVFDLGPPEDIPKLLEAMTLYDGEKPTVSGVFRHCKKDGSVIEVEAVSHRIDFEGRPARWVMITDVTERMLADRKLRRSEERLTAALSAGNLGVFDTDIVADKHNCDERIREIWGIGDGEPLSKAIFAEGINPGDLARVREAVRSARRSPGLHAYVAEYRVRNRRSGVERWVHADGNVSVSEGSVRILGTLQDITERKRAERQVQLLMREVNHRSKNMLAVVQAIASQTAARSKPEEFATTFIRRLLGLSASHDLLVKSEWQGVSLADLVTSQLDHFGLSTGAIQFEGPPVYLTPPAAQALGMALHELATNSAKYGSLSTGGKVGISWTTDREGNFAMSWSETGGAAVSPPRHTGLGSRLLTEMTAMSLQGEVKLDYAPTGLRWEIVAPMKVVSGCESSLFANNVSD